MNEQLSGAHFNPAVSLVFALRRDLPWSQFVAYLAAQIVGAILRVLAAHAMLDLPRFGFASHRWQKSIDRGKGPGYHRNSG
jgi:glycerol uptake facilitator-like aquaporin